MRLVLPFLKVGLELSPGALGCWHRVDLPKDLYISLFSPKMPDSNAETGASDLDRADSLERVEDYRKLSLPGGPLSVDGDPAAEMGLHRWAPRASCVFSRVFFLPNRKEDKSISKHTVGKTKGKIAKARSSGNFHSAWRTLPIRNFICRFYYKLVYDTNDTMPRKCK